MNKDTIEVFAMMLFIFSILMFMSTFLFTKDYIVNELELNNLAFRFSFMIASFCIGATAFELIRDKN